MSEIIVYNKCIKLKDHKTTQKNKDLLKCNLESIPEIWDDLIEQAKEIEAKLIKYTEKFDGKLTLKPLLERI